VDRQQGVPFIIFPGELGFELTMGDLGLDYGDFPL